MFNTTRADGIGTSVVVWQSKNTQVAQGGFTLDDDAFAVGTVIPIGAPIGYDESTRLAKVAKMGVMQDAATNTDTTYKVEKNHLLAVGMSIKAEGGSAYAITDIDTTDPAFDVVTVGTTLGVTLAAGDAIFVDDAGYSGVKGLNYQNIMIGDNGLAEVTVGIRGTVYARRIPPLAAVVRAKLPLIVFSESF